MQPDPVRHFFEEALPAKAAAELHRLFACEGRVAFKVADRAWTFRFANVEPVVSRFDREADLQLWFTPDAFAAFIDGSLGVAAAVKSGAVKARGDVSLLETFGRFLQNDAATLGWDAAG